MIAFDPASFKDPAGRVFYHGEWVYRTLSASARSGFEDARAAKLIDRLVDDGLLVATDLVPSASLGIADPALGEFVLKQPKIAFVSYSCEWSFEMLRDAALGTLRVIDTALDAGFLLKDANAFNILFDGCHPKLADVLSIERYREGEVWAGYAQFCRSFLFPLLITAYRGIDVSQLLIGTLGEVPVSQARTLLRGRDMLRPGVLKDVVLQARLERTFARSPGTVRSATRGQQYPKALLTANVRRLMRIIERLPKASTVSEWSAYDTLHNYSAADRAAKASFVERTFTVGRFTRVADLGCNTGDYTRIVANSGARVIALDLDARAIDTLYRNSTGSASISPVVASLLCPTPAVGWRLRERRSLLDRMDADGFLALALIHHLRISGNVPLGEIVDQLFSIAPEGIVEWVDKADTQVRDMLALRPDVYDDYTWPEFERLLRARGQILAIQETHDGARRLCHVRSSVARGRESAS